MHDMNIADVIALSAAIDYVTPAFEVVGFRYDGSVGQIVDTIADNAGCSGIVVGEEKHPYGSVDLKAVELVITGGGQEITRGIGSNVLGDPIKFRRIIANLVGNAVKFTENGHVHAELEFEERNGRLRAQLTVRDTGIGIPQDRLESIFEPFTQADASTTRRFGGTGLGLTIVRSLTQAMDGYMKVMSEVGTGSSFAATVMVEPNPAFTPPPQP